MNSTHIGDTQATDRGQDVTLQEDFISLGRPRLTLRPNVRLKEGRADLAERGDGSRSALGRDWINSLLCGSQELFCCGACLVRRQSAVIAKDASTRASGVSKLCEIRFFSARKCDDAKSRKSLVPQELAIFAGRANKGVYGAFRNATFRQLATR